MTSYDIMFFSAHPDDVEYDMGGTYLKLCKKYSCIHIMLTKGEAGSSGTPEERMQEAIDAANFAGCELEFMDFTDNYVEDTNERALKIAAIIRKHRPKIVFVPYHTNNHSHIDGHAHPDHLNAGRLVVKAARFAKFKGAKVTGDVHSINNLIFYMAPRHSKPSFTVDVSDVMDDLKKLWLIHKTQKDIRDGKIVDLLTTMRKFHAVMNTYEFAEAFIVEEPIRMNLDNILNI